MTTAKDHVINLKSQLIPVINLSFRVIRLGIGMH
jgi:hypothetical protein